MPADPQDGMHYRQEYYKGKAEDNGEILSTNEKVRSPFGQFEIRAPDEGHYHDRAERTRVQTVRQKASAPAVALRGLRRSGPAARTSSTSIPPARRRPRGRNGAARFCRVNVADPGAGRGVSNPPLLQVNRSISCKFSNSVARVGESGAPSRFSPIVSATSGRRQRGPSPVRPGA